MRVAFISRSTLLTVRGGDTTQVEQTASHLEKFNVQVDILLTDQVIDYTQYDILHFFNIIRPSDILIHAKRAKCPIVISPIYVDYSSFDQSERTGVFKLIARSLGRFGSEYLKTLLRAIKGQDRLMSPSYLLGHKDSMKKAAQLASILLPNSESEAKRVLADLGNNLQYKVIPYAIDPNVFYPDLAEERDPTQIICVGQIEGRKNQHRLIQTTMDLGLKLVVIGKPSPNNEAYFEHCKELANEHVRFIDFQPQHELRKWYSRSKVHVLPSWFETAGLTSLEAAACGCRVVVGDAGDTRDYFEGGAVFCEPGSIESIKTAILKAIETNLTPVLQKRIETEFNWENTAKKTLEAYQHVLN